MAAGMDFTKGVPACGPWNPMAEAELRRLSELIGALNRQREPALRELREYLRSNQPLQGTTIAGSVDWLAGHASELRRLLAPFDTTQEAK
jgi:hypothetical protein